MVTKLYRSDHFDDPQIKKYSEINHVEMMYDEDGYAMNCEECGSFWLADDTYMTDDGLEYDFKCLDCEERSNKEKILAVERMKEAGLDV